MRSKYPQINVEGSPANADLYHALYTIGARSHQLESLADLVMIYLPND